MKQFKSASQAERFLSAHDQINNLFYLRRDHVTAAELSGTRYRPLAALADAVQIVRGLLRHETVTYRGRAFSAGRVALEFAAPRPDMPIHLAAMADRSLALCV